MVKDMSSGQETDIFNCPTILYIKNLGLEKSDANLEHLIYLFHQDLGIDLKREIVSSIGRQTNSKKIYDFISQEVFNNHYMEVVYQMFRTVLYRSKSDMDFKNLKDKILDFYKNEVMYKMVEFYEKKQRGNLKLNFNRQITRPTILVGDNRQTLKKIKDNQINLIFTSPPYYNAREYSDYKNYKEYLEFMYDTLEQCHRILEDGRFILINVSPVITKRVGRI